MKKEKILDLIKSLIATMGILTEDIAVTEAAGHTLFTVKTKDSGVLIGTRGETLSALNHLVKKLLEKEGGDEDFHFVIDVNGYHLKHIKALEAQARMLAERSRTFKYDIEMSPMSAYDRMIVHASLKDSPNITTESFGEGKLRHIVIKYIADAGTVPNEPAAPSSTASFSGF